MLCPSCVDVVDPLMDVLRRTSVYIVTLLSCFIVQDSLIDMLRRTSVHFVHCILPQHNAGLCDLKNSSATPPVGVDKPLLHEDALLNVPLIRSQIRGAEIVNAVRLHRQGS